MDILNQFRIESNFIIQRNVFQKLLNYGKTSYVLEYLAL